GASRDLRTHGGLAAALALALVAALAGVLVGLAPAPPLAVVPALAAVLAGLLPDGDAGDRLLRLGVGALGVGWGGCGPGGAGVGLVAGRRVLGHGERGRGGARGRAVAAEGRQHAARGGEREGAPPVVDHGAP